MSSDGGLAGADCLMLQARSTLACNGTNVKLFSKACEHQAVGRLTDLDEWPHISGIVSMATRALYSFSDCNPSGKQ